MTLFISVLYIFRQNPSGSSVVSELHRFRFGLSCTMYAVFFPSSSSCSFFYLLFFMVRMECGGHRTVCLVYSLHIFFILLCSGEESAAVLYYVSISWHCDGAIGILG